MTPEDRGTFVNALTTLAEARNETLSDMRAEAYYLALEDLDIAEVLYAINRALKTGIYPKLETPGKLRELVGGSPEQDAEAAWLTAIDAVRSVGYYRMPQLPAVVMATLDKLYGGWQSACAEIPTQSSRDFESHRRRFLATYAIVESRERFVLPPHLRKCLDGGK